jgi:hypothetical protein
MRSSLARSALLSRARALLGGAQLVGSAVALLSAAAPARAQGKAIYTCIDASGKRLTSDRPIPECNAREQRELNADGSVKRIVPPTMTADERADAEAREREAALERATRSDAVRRDRNLLARFPNEAAHNKAREAALDGLRKAVQISQERLALLAAERKPLIDETEFYVGKPLPLKLKTQLDANDAATTAQREIAQNQQSEMVRISALYDAELERLRKLWGGVQPGTLGALPAATMTTAGSPAKPPVK